MNRSIAFWSGLAAAGLALIALCSCDYSSSIPEIHPLNWGPICCCRTGTESGRCRRQELNAPRPTEQRKAILDCSVTLIQWAALQPGGTDDEQAIKS